MKDFIIMVIIIGMVFLANSSVPSYEEHANEVEKLLKNNTNTSFDFLNYFTYFDDERFNTLARMGLKRYNCEKYQIYKFDLASKCTFTFSNSNAIGTFGVFNKVFILNK
ncbi:hypothetical protein [Campylobacter geochelonis]|uniref:hypothetical protein n=1 Tax=Campylobacter geochelonis TaxID=1780362 RepID=UPI000770B2B5|nr:hypothetical protein [Campylobacter geochelonis]CZE46933.1 Uncharacterised protein [Campylobacter geochelonis]CZE50916.1 Uncharacterised protein [Campylobacter geochelonis]